MAAFLVENKFYSLKYLQLLSTRAILSFSLSEFLMMQKKNPCAITSRFLTDLAKVYVAEIGKKMRCNPRLMLQLWPEVIGSHIASMTRAIKFENTVLFVLVSNSSLLSLLHRKEEKKLLIEGFQNKAPGVHISDIIFRLG